MSGNVAICRRVLPDCFFYVLLFLECLEMLLFLEGFWLIFFGVFVIFRMSGNIAIFRRVLADFCACFCYF
jgi:hypothetical protein